MDLSAEHLRDFLTTPSVKYRVLEGFVFLIFGGLLALALLWLGNNWPMVTYPILAVGILVIGGIWVIEGLPKHWK
jgi:hypothetical protein